VGYKSEVIPSDDQSGREPKGHDEEDDDTPETPLDEPAPTPIVDPPPDDSPKPPLVAR